MSLDLGSMVPWLAFGLSIIVFIWQIVNWRLSAARVRVYVGPAAFTGHSLSRGPHIAGDFTPHPDLRRPRRYWEVFEITVENVGRTAVTITNPCIDVYPTRGRPKLAFSRVVKKAFGDHVLPYRRTMSTSLVNFRGMANHLDRQRIEPYDMVSYLMHAESIALQFRDQPLMWARASVRVAGRREPVLSSRWKAIRLGDGRWGFKAEKPSPDVVAFRSMLDHDPDDASDVAAIVWKIWKDGPPEDGHQLADVVAREAERRTVGGKLTAMLWGRKAADALAKYEYVPPRWSTRRSETSSQTADHGAQDPTALTSTTSPENADSEVPEPTS